MKDLTDRKPRKDLVNDNRFLIGFLVRVLGLARQIRKGNEPVFEVKQRIPKV